MASWKESMINRLSNLINCNRSAAKISQVLCSSQYTIWFQFLPSNYKPCPLVQPLLNPVQTKREYFWLFLIVIVENAIALVVEVRSSIIFSLTV